MQEEIGAVRHLLTDTLEAITQMDELPDMIEETIVAPAGGGGGGLGVGGSMGVSLSRLALEGAAGYDLQHHSDEVLDMLDELDGRIVEHRFDAAVACIEKAWAVLESAEQGEQEARVLDAELRDRIPAVVDGIWKQVQSTTLATMKVTDAVALLGRLRQKENAMELFLSLRTHFLQKEMAKLDDALKEVKSALNPSCGGLLPEALARVKCKP